MRTGHAGSEIMARASRRMAWLKSPRLLRTVDTVWPAPFSSLASIPNAWLSRSELKSRYSCLIGIRLHSRLPWRRYMSQSVWNVIFYLNLVQWAALSSVADLCCLEIASRTARSRESWSVILKVRVRARSPIGSQNNVQQGGQLLHVGDSIRWRRESAGTVVSVRDAFFNVSAAGACGRIALCILTGH